MKGKDVLSLLELRQIAHCEVPGENLIYAYVDGFRPSDSSVEVEWYLEFRFEGDDLMSFDIQKHLVGL